VHSGVNSMSVSSVFRLQNFKQATCNFDIWLVARLLVVVDLCRIRCSAHVSRLCNFSCTRAEVAPHCALEHLHHQAKQSACQGGIPTSLT